jgi:hypothetical protein
MNRIEIDDEKLSDAIIDHAIAMSKLDVITIRDVFQASRETVTMASEREIAGSAKFSGTRHAPRTQVENAIRGSLKYRHSNANRRHAQQCPRRQRIGPGLALLERHNPLRGLK